MENSLSASACAPRAFLSARRLLCGVIFVAAWAFYAFCTSPTVTRGGDCGELIAASYRLGIAHPSGYPTYCLAARLWALVFPFGEIAWRYNLFSGLCAALAAAVVTAIVHRLVGAQNPQRAVWAAGGAGFLMAGSFVVASQAIIAEVYTLAALLLALLWLCALAWRQEGDWRWFYSLGALCGLAFVTHLSVVFALPGLLLMALAKSPHEIGPKRIGGALLCALALFALAVYLPLRSQLFPEPPVAGPINESVFWPLDWTHPTTFSRFRAHLTASQYRDLLFAPGPQIAGVQIPTLAQPLALLPVRLSAFLLIIGLQYLWITPVLLVGAWAAFRKEKILGWALFLTAFFNLGVELNYNVGDQANFFFPTYLVLAIWMGLGLAQGAEWIGRARGIWNWRLKTGAILLLPTTILVQWAVFATFASLRDKTLVRDVVLEQAQTLNRANRPATIFLFSDDMLWPFWYVQHVLGHAPGIWTPWGRGTQHAQDEGKLPAYTAQLMARGPVYFAQWKGDVDARFPLVLATPSGALWRAEKRDLPAPAQVISSSPTKTPGPNGLLSAQVPRVDLWKKGESASPQILWGCAAALQVDFRGFVPLEQRLARRDSKHRARLAGRIEILLVPEDQFANQTPPPDQKSLTESSQGEEKLVISHQIRRLVVPETMRSGQILRATLPLEASLALTPGIHRIFVRILPPGADSNTPWTLCDSVQISANG